MNAIGGVLQCVCEAPTRVSMAREKYRVALRCALWDAIETMKSGAAEMLCECLRRLNERRWDEDAQRATWDEFQMLHKTLDNIEHLEAVGAVTHGPDTVARILAAIPVVVSPRATR